MSLDDELLMLAGEDDQDTKLPSPPRRKRSSPPTSASPVKKRSKPAAKKTKSKKVIKKTDSDDDNDDGDDEDSSALSEAHSSDISSHSDADEAMDLASSSDEEDSVQDLYPLEGKYKDSADMSKLLAMEEIAREAELAERAAQIERAQQDRHLRNLLKSRNAASDKVNELFAGGGSSTRRSARTKSMPKKNEETTKRGKLEELKKAREDRSTRAAGSGKAERGDDDGPKRRSVADDDDDEKTGFAEDIYIASKEERKIQVSDANRARIGRTGLGKLCDYPGFEEAVRDCFVRVSLYDREKETTAYRIGQIKGFITGKPYTMLDGKRRTDQHVLIQHGLSEKSFAMEFLSDSPMTEAEFTRFKKQLEFDKVALPSLSLVEKKAQDIRALDSRTLTPEEFEAMITKRNKDKIDPVKVALARSKLRQAREMAVSNGDEAEILRIDKELQELEDSKGRPLARAESQMDRLARLNAENRKRNTAELRKAELDEKRAARRAAEEAERNGKMSNPFMRVRTKARVMHNSVEVRAEKTEGEAAPAEESTPKGVGLIGNGAKKRRMGGVDDVIASLDFGIDIEI